MSPDAGVPRAQLCLHCWRPQRGRATVWIDEVPYALCHSDTGLDCYRLVTIYGHQPYLCACAMQASAGNLITDENV
jgi:hypothetical protein